MELMRTESIQQQNKKPGFYDHWKAIKDLSEVKSYEQKDDFGESTGK